ncbi:serine protease [Saliphagus sp. LR7]|uniref:S1 family peptidase n=1 Tax=Saliphagus sp. LR7 TaxID=2282654 RepID=UPI000DF75638|nr:serine protease [Saliphagus sp. LR7]
MVYDHIASSTVQIHCDEIEGPGDGSGFHFQDENTIVTNAHVIESAIVDHDDIWAVTEEDEESRLELLTHSPSHKYDYALLNLKEGFSNPRNVLNPKLGGVDRGQQICFAGFPHGINDLLVQEARVSGPKEDYGFYIDGSVNGGNSGGPIVDADDGKIVGIVTERRYLTPIDMDEISREINALRQRYQKGVGFDMVMGDISLNGVLELIAESLGRFEDIMQANANTGIGIGYQIMYANDAYDSL